MATEWKVQFYTEADGSVPVQEFLRDSDLTPGELKQFQTRFGYIQQMGLSILGQRADILETLEGETAKGIYSLRCPNTPNNPRILLCTLVGQNFVLLHGFKEQNGRDYDAAIKVAARRKKVLDKAEEVKRQVEAEQKKGRKKR